MKSSQRVLRAIWKLSNASQVQSSSSTKRLPVVEWDEYKILADTPGNWTRWMVQQIQELLQQSPAVSEQLSRRIRLALLRPPIAQPTGFKGGRVADLLPLVLSTEDTEHILWLVETAHEAEKSLSLSQSRGGQGGQGGRGFGGFTEAWVEYHNSLRNKTTHAEDLVMADAENIVLELIEGFNQIDIDKIVNCFTPEAVYHNIPMEAVSGHAGIRAALEPFLGGSSKVQWDLLSIASNNSGHVLTERVDKFEIGGKWLSVRVMGIFEVNEGKISAWRDYFDLAEFQSQMAG